MRSNLNHIVAAILLIGSLACNSSETQPSSASAEKSDIQKVKLSRLDGSPIDLKKYQGKTVFINFWATWCKPCLQEMPSIAVAQGLLEKEGVVFLMASDESAEQIEQFKSEHEFKFNYVRIDNAPDLNIMGLPTTFIYNPEGKLVFSEMSSRKWDEKENLELILQPKNMQ